jgi:hypothetical protein
MVTPTNTATGSVDSSPIKEFFLNTRRTSFLLAVLPQARPPVHRRSHCEAEQLRLGGRGTWSGWAISVPCAAASELITDVLVGSGRASSIVEFRLSLPIRGRFAFLRGLRQLGDRLPEGVPAYLSHGCRTPILPRRKPNGLGCHTAAIYSYLKVVATADGFVTPHFKLNCWNCWGLR